MRFGSPLCINPAGDTTSYTKCIVLSKKGFEIVPFSDEYMKEFWPEKYEAEQDKAEKQRKLTEEYLNKEREIDIEKNKILETEVTLEGFVSKVDTFFEQTPYLNLSNIKGNKDISLLITGIERQFPLEARWVRITYIPLNARRINPKVFDRYFFDVSRRFDEPEKTGYEGVVRSFEYIPNP